MHKNCSLPPSAQLNWKRTGLMKSMEYSTKGIKDTWRKGMPESVYSVEKL